MSRAAMQQALEALHGMATWVEQRPNLHPWDAWQRVEPAIAALRAALAEPAEPVAVALHTGTKQGIKWHREVEHGTPLYTALKAALADGDKLLPTEPFGYFRSEPFGWTDCAPDDEGAVPLYATPPQRKPLVDPAEYDDAGAAERYNRGLK